MRYVFAITSLALAALFAIMGIGQLTFLSGPPATSQELKVNPKMHYSVIESDVLMSNPGQATLQIEGSGVVFAAYGTSRDVAAWVAPFEHEVFSLKEGTTEIESKKVAAVQLDEKALAIAEYPTSATDYKNPAGSDLWLSEAVQEKKVTLYTDADETTSIIFASDGKGAQPTNVTMLWLKDRNAPWFGPLMLLSLIFALLGLVLYLLAVDRDRRSKGPRRGKTGPLQGLRDLWGDALKSLKERRSGTTTEHPEAVVEPETRTTRVATRGLTLFLAGLTVTTVLATTGCSPRYWPAPSETPSATPTTSEPVDPELPVDEAEEQIELPPVPVTEPHLKAILIRIADLSGKADADRSEDLIKSRFVGSALDQRVANYKIRGAVPETAAPVQLTSDLAGYNLIQSTEGWPRTILATVDSRFPEGTTPPTGSDGKPVSSPTLALLLKQVSPYSNYFVHDVVEIRGGVVFPEAISAEEGVAVVPNNTAALLLPPGEVGDAFAQILVQGEAAPNNKLFDLKNDPLLAQMGKAWLEKAQAEAASKGESVQYSLDIRQADDTVALSTGADGALVTVTVNEKHIATSTQARGSVKLTPSVQALSGLSGSKKSIYQLWQHQMLFFVPNEGSATKIQVLGSTTAMTGAGEG